MLYRQLSDDLRLFFVTGVLAVACSGATCATEIPNQTEDPTNPGFQGGIVFRCPGDDVTVSQKEILLALLQNGRTTRFTGKACSAEALKDQVGVRQNTVASSWTTK